jgi:hypothetical protein
VEVRWQPPEQDNGALVTSYVLEYALAKKVGGMARGAAACRSCKPPLFSLPETNSILLPLSSPIISMTIFVTVATIRRKYKSMCMRHPGPPPLPAAAAAAAAAAGSSHTNPPVCPATQSASWSKAYQGPDTSCTISALNPGRTYRLRVRAHNSCGFGPFSEPRSCSSQPAPPSAPGKPSFSGKNSNSVKVKWSLPEEDFGSVVTAYTLQVAGLEGHYADAYHGEGLGLVSCNCWKVLRV